MIFNRLVHPIDRKLLFFDIQRGDICTQHDLNFCRLKGIIIKENIKLNKIKIDPTSNQASSLNLILSQSMPSDLLNLVRS